MKRIVTAVFIAATSLALMVSCQKTETGNSEIFEETPSVSITLKDEGNTKAFFDNTSTAENFEKSLSSLSILVFDMNSQMIVRRNFSQSELQAKKCTFRLPKTVGGTACLFVGVANYSVGEIKTLEQLYTLMEAEAANYNGTFAEVTSAAKRTGGFVMSGTVSQTVNSTGSTEVAISLKRTVAKIAIQTSVAENFETLYGGKITVLSATIKNGAEGTWLMASDNDNNSPLTYTHTQSVGTSDGKFNSLFYLYENLYSTGFKAPTITLDVLYDLDGDDSTTGDRRQFTYEFSLTGVGGGEIDRNGYYRVVTTIKGPEGTDCAVNVNVADWETPSTQNIDLGI